MIRVLLFTERVLRRQKFTGRVADVFPLSNGWRGIIVKLLWFEQLEFFLEYADLDREIGFETKVWILYEQRILFSWTFLPALDPLNLL